MEREVCAVLGPIGVNDKLSKQVAQNLHEVEVSTSGNAEEESLRWSKEVGLTKFLLKFGEGIGTSFLPPFLILFDETTLTMMDGVCRGSADEENVHISVYDRDGIPPRRNHPSPPLLLHKIRPTRSSLVIHPHRHRSPHLRLGTSHPPPAIYQYRKLMIDGL